MPGKGYPALSRLGFAKARFCCASASLSLRAALPCAELPSCEGLSCPFPARLRKSAVLLRLRFAFATRRTSCAGLKKRAEARYRLHHCWL